MTQTLLIRDVPEEPTVATKAAATTTVFRRHYTECAYLVKYGIMAVCPACDETRLGEQRAGVPRTDQF